MRFLADENVDNALIRGLLLQKATFDIVRVQDVGLRTQDDPTVLAWAAEHERIVITHDVATMSVFAYQRVAVGLPMPGIFAIPQSVAVGVAINELLLIDEASDPEDWANKVTYLPF